jgi:glycosyltransferase involved in cell wall biosynthesis
MLTVICPTYNRADLLRDCTAALMELPNGVAEVVVVDDCSTDRMIKWVATANGLAE